MPLEQIHRRPRALDQGVVVAGGEPEQLQSLFDARVGERREVLCSAAPKAATAERRGAAATAAAAEDMPEL